VVLMDMRMPEMDSFATTRAIKQRYPEVSVLIQTMHEEQGYLLEAINAGAAGYVLKQAPKGELITAMRKVLEGETAVNRNLAMQLLRRLAPGARGSGGGLVELRGAQPTHPPMPRELEILELLAQGRSNREIGQDFMISTVTVKRHVENLMPNLQASDPTQAAIRALELWLIHVPESPGRLVPMQPGSTPP
jgi:two-component system, NarL family, response regulator DegU